MVERRKLIEVALPLGRINEAAFREKNRKVGKPQNLHHWWSRKPITSSRALLAAQLIDDPASHPDKFPSSKQVEAERKRLHDLIAALADWDRLYDNKLLQDARNEILLSNQNSLPTIVDPFVGGGSLLLAAQQLGLPSVGSDLNPLAVILSKALLEVPPMFTDAKPVAPEVKGSQLHWSQSSGLAADVQAYSDRILARAKEELAGAYPGDGSSAAAPIAHVWVRTVACPSPACRTKAPLASTWLLSKKQDLILSPISQGETGQVAFIIKSGKSDLGAKAGTVDRNGARCVLCSAAIDFEYIRKEGLQKRLGSQLVAAVYAEGRGRTYRVPSASQIAAAAVSTDDFPDQLLPPQALGFRVQGYGVGQWSELFTPRQLVALTTFGNLVSAAHSEVLEDALAAGMPAGESLDDGGSGARAYADAVTLYLSLVVSRMADWNNSFAPWDPVGEVSQHLFTGQSIPMCWNYSEANPLGPGNSGSWSACTKSIVTPLRMQSGSAPSRISMTDARRVSFDNLVIATDPPYFDNIGYSDLSDFFYVWQRRTLRSVFPSVFGTILVPKAGELVANQIRAGSADAAADEFESGFTEVFERMRSEASADFPVTIYFASRQNERVRLGETSTSWSTILTALIGAGWHLVRTWPLRAENASRTVAQGSNAMAAAVVLVARPRDASAATTDRRGFLGALKSELPIAIAELIEGGISPVDLAQAAAGPGVSIYSRYARIVEVDGGPMTVKSALSLISKVLDEIMTEHEGDFDKATSFAVQWYRARGYVSGPFGDADSLASGRGVSVAEVARTGILVSRASNVRLVKPADYEAYSRLGPEDNFTIWGVLHSILQQSVEGGISAAGRLLAAIRAGTSDLDESALPELAHLLFRVAEENKWTADAISFNNLVTAWPEILDEARAAKADGQQQSLALDTHD